VSDYIDDYVRSGYSGPIPPITENILGHFDPDGSYHAVVNGVNTTVTVVQDMFPDETRIVDASGGAKGSKLARFDMIPPDVLWELAEHYGKGEAKYPSDPETGQPNWQRGYSYRLSVAALMRHLTSWLMGEDVDPETGSSHLIAVIWHAMALRYFQLHDKGKDYR
jgi:hypothetical protein